MSTQEAEKLLERLSREAAAGGYFLNPDRDLVLDLMEGLATNQRRYGYLACPCRLAEGKRELDRDIICPCDWRDADLDEHGACFCGLYVSEKVRRGEAPLKPVPERRPPPAPSPADSATLPAPQPAGALAGKLPVWRCRVCGYLCAREQPPLKCPVCKAEKDRFDRFV